MDNDTLFIGLNLLAMLGLVAANGFFVATEFALVSVRRSRIDSMVSEGNRRAVPVLAAIKDLDGYIAATQLGITISSIGLGWIGEPALAALLDPLLESIVPPALAVISTHTIAFIIAFAIVTFLHVVFGELAPKSYALQYPEKTSMAVAVPTTIFLKIFKPIIYSMNATGQFFLRSIGVEPAAEHSLVYSEEELRLIVAASRKGGELVDVEEEIIRRAFVFHDYAADEIMVPRTEIIALSVEAGLDEVKDVLSTGKFGRYPVYDQTIDDIVGIVYVKDLFPILTGRQADSEFNIRSLVRPALPVPTSIPIDTLLNVMKRERTHVAILVDEYGGTAGMVTLEDIVERLLGDIPDEFESPESQTQVQPDGSRLVSGLTLLSDVNEELGLHLEAEDNNTIGGYVFSEIGHLPEIGDVVNTGAYLIRVEELDNLRIAELRFIPTQEMDADRSRGEDQLEESGITGARRAAEEH
jgi:CBS domain containing-hemolysin-like protein